jgi:hypothetical protein
MKPGYKSDTFKFIFIVALFTIAKIWNRHWCLSTDEWIKKNTPDIQWSIIQNEILSFAGKWMKLEDIILSEVKLDIENQVVYIFSHM